MQLIKDKLMMFRIPAKLKEEMQAQAKKDGCTAGELIRELIIKHLKEKAR